MTKLLWPALCGAVASIAGMAALAQDLPAPRDAGAPPPDLAAPPHRPPHQPLTRADATALADRAFAALDTNGDGAVTRAEYEAAREARRAERADRGQDGAGGAPHSPRAPGMMAMGPRWFDMADANGDGRVTPAEARTAAGAAFDRMDADHDGIVTPEERRVAMAAARDGRDRPAPR